MNRRTFEYEKAVNEELAEHRQIMEKNLISMAPYGGAWGIYDKHGSARC
ncbi:hypothetical protein Pint_09049 [Pistacia integerrima]|uniref:Uncharacterized protein n=1 Tax=Pistacia integerrima TaxID=434235 RepID=A0ACC0XTC5_9ROSI|nr:hypothetical protein Pint_09049 [Pistacia integerrima]